MQLPAGGKGGTYQDRERSRLAKNAEDTIESVLSDIGVVGRQQGLLLDVVEAAVLQHSGGFADKDLVSQAHPVECRVCNHGHGLGTSNFKVLLFNQGTTPDTGSHDASSRDRYMEPDIFPPATLTESLRSSSQLRSIFVRTVLLYIYLLHITRCGLGRHHGVNCNLRDQGARLQLRRRRFEIGIPDFMISTTT